MSETSPKDFEVPAVSRFLSERLGDGVERVAFLADGAWSRCFSFSSGGSNLVVKFGQHVEDFEKDKLASDLTRGFLPAPQVIDIGEFQGNHYAISERVFGSPIDQSDADGWRSALPLLFSTLDQMRDVDLSDSRGYGLWGGNGAGSHDSWHEYLLSVIDDPVDRRVYGWKERLRRSPVGDGPFLQAYSILETLIRVLEESGESTEERRLVHGDLLLNTLVSEGGISGLLDWGCSVYGDFLYDHAWIAFWSPWYPSMKSFDIVADTKLHLKNVGADIENFDSRMRCCLIHIGLDGQAYNAFTGDWESLEMTANRTSEVATWGCLG